MVTKNYRVYSPEILKEAYKSFEQDPIEILHDNKAIFELQYHQVSDVVFRPARWVDNYEKFKTILKSSKLEIGWKAYYDEINQKVHNSMRNKTELGRSIYGDKDILLKIDHVSLVPKED